jgi:hypothetical protein
LSLQDTLSGSPDPQSTIDFFNSLADGTDSAAGPVGQCQTAYQAYVATGTGAVAVNAQYSAMKAQCGAAVAAVAPVQDVSMGRRQHTCVNN